MEKLSGSLLEIQNGILEYVEKNPPVWELEDLPDEQCVFRSQVFWLPPNGNKHVLEVDISELSEMELDYLLKCGRQFATHETRGYYTQGRERGREAILRSKLVLKTWEWLLGDLILVLEWR
jgi:hypothetical protein